jgi:hypothetical protein
MLVACLPASDREPEVAPCRIPFAPVFMHSCGQERVRKSRIAAGLEALVAYQLAGC